MDDYEFILLLLNNFFGQRKIKKSLTLISEKGVSGWEVWLQIEFATFLAANYDNEIEWHREFKARVDGRTLWGRKMLAADFVLRRKGYKKDEYIVLEFKQNASARKCFSEMIKDIAKINSARRSDMGIRNFWVVGLHPKNDLSKSEIRDHISNVTDYDRGCIDTRFIVNTDFAYTIF